MKFIKKYWVAYRVSVAGKQVLGNEQEQTSLMKKGTAAIAAGP